VHSVRGVVAHAFANAPKMRHTNATALLAELSYEQVAMAPLSGEFDMVAAERYALWMVTPYTRSSLARRVCRVSRYMFTTK
jgi:hypothetical protein